MTCRCEGADCALPIACRYECGNCEKRWATPSAAEDCCGDWLGYD